mgnify:FL=1
MLDAAGRSVDVLEKVKEKGRAVCGGDGRAEGDGEGHVLAIRECECRVGVERIREEVETVRAEGQVGVEWRIAWGGGGYVWPESTIGCSSIGGDLEGGR